MTQTYLLLTKIRMLSNKKFYMFWKNYIWFQINDLILNIKKIHSNQLQPPNKPRVVFNNNETDFPRRFLGIYITEILKWNVHVHSLHSNLSEVSDIIKSLKAVLSPYMLRSIYFSYFLSRLRNGIILWGENSESKGHLKWKKGHSNNQWHK